MANPKPNETAAPLVPKSRSLPRLREAAATCKACPLWEGTTQTVFGEGTSRAKVMLIGEQPGDREDIEGKPFVGPAGRLLGEALEEAGIGRRGVYTTNMVKHFKWTPAGKRRLHKKPNAREIAACRPWLDAEMSVIRPAIVVALGATAARALMGSSFRVTRERAKVIDVEWGERFLATLHPSSVLRVPDHEGREQARKDFFADLRTVAQWLSAHK